MTFNQNIKEETILGIKSGLINPDIREIRSEYYDDCYLILENRNPEYLRKRIFENYILYKWWDILTFEELLVVLNNFYFTKSTKLLLKEGNVNKYGFKFFQDKNDIINKIYENFEFPIDQIRFDKDSLGIENVWNLKNNIVKSIRIIENDIRLFYNEKIIGSLYNENLLFKQVSKRFGEKYKVISQGNPHWLGNQRFDIYFPELNIGIEYQGEQHFRPVDFGGKGREVSQQQFLENQKRDIIKKQKSIENDCILIFVLPKYDLETVLNEIENSIKLKTLMCINQINKNI
jgi:hypothetical protein